MLGGFFAVYGWALIRLLFEAEGRDIDGLALVLAMMVFCFVACAIRAYHAYRLVGQLRATIESEPEQARSQAMPAVRRQV